jgi:hypothetical protein
MIDHPIITNPLFWICVIATVALIAYLVGMSPSKKNYEIHKNLAVIAFAISATGIAYIMVIAPAQQIWHAASH